MSCYDYERVGVGTALASLQVWKRVAGVGIALCGARRTRGRLEARMHPAGLLGTLNVGNTTAEFKALLLSIGPALK